MIEASGGAEDEVTSFAGEPAMAASVAVMSAGPAWVSADAWLTGGGVTFSSSRECREAHPTRVTDRARTLAVTRAPVMKRLETMLSPDSCSAGTQAAGAQAWRPAG